jgi:hypothetical protein
MATDAERKARYRDGYRWIHREVHLPTLIADGFLDKEDVDNDAAIEEAGFRWLARKALILPDLTATAVAPPVRKRPKAGRVYQPKNGPIREVPLDEWQEGRAKVAANIARRLDDAWWLHEDKKRRAKLFDDGCAPTLRAKPPREGLEIAVVPGRTKKKG